MKYVLAAMCGIVVLFMGGCAVIFSATVNPGFIIPGAIAFLNLAIIGGLFGWRVQWRPAFYILGILDLLIAVGCVLTVPAFNMSDPTFAPFMYTVAGVFGLKGFLSFVYARCPA
jgi:hypothetical protein